MKSFKEFLFESKPIIKPSLEEIETYEWVTDKELRPDNIIELLKKPIMYSYDNKSHNIQRIKSMDYNKEKKIVYCSVVLDNAKSIELKVFHAFGGVMVEEVSPFTGTVVHDKEFSPNDLESKYKSDETKKPKGSTPEDYYV